MTPEELAAHVRDLESAAQFVEAIDNRSLQSDRGWNLTGWEYELVPWGVRFVHRYPSGRSAEVLVLVAGPAANAPAGDRSDLRVVVSGA